MDSKFLAFGIALLLQAGGIVWWASGLQSAVRHNAFQVEMMRKDVAHNSKFVLEWPSGSWLSGQPLPSDIRQDSRLTYLESQVAQLMKTNYGLNGGD